MPKTAALPAGPLPPPSRVLLTVRQLSEQQPGLTQGSLRWLLFNAKHNGLDKSGAVLRVGPKKILIDSERFLDWLASQSQRKDAA